eukprot:377178_1
MGNNCTHAPPDHWWEVTVSSWTTAHVFTWLSSVDNGELKPVAILFKKHKINGIDLIALSRDDDKRLQSMKVVIGDRVHFKQELNALLMNRSIVDLSPIPETSTVPKLQLSPSHTNKHPKQCAAQINANPPQPMHTIGPRPQPPITMITHANITPTVTVPPPIHVSHMPKLPYTHYNARNSLITPLNLNNNSEQCSDSSSSDEDIPSKKELKVPTLQPFKRSQSPIQVLKDIMSNSTTSNNQGNDDHFVMLDSPTHSSHHEEDSSVACDTDEEEEGSNWHVKNLAYDTYNRFAPTFPAGARPGLVNMPSNKSTTLIHRALGCAVSNAPPIAMPHNDDDDDDGEYKGSCMVMMNGYGDDDDQDEEMEFNFEEDHMEYFDTSSDDSYPYPSAIDQLTSRHHTTLFMLQTTKTYLLNGYLRNEGIHKIMRIPKAITDVVLDYYDDSSMAFDIKIRELLSKSNGFNKLEGTSFKFELNMDHKIKLRPTLTHRIRRDMTGNIDENEVDGIHEFNDIELALECEALPIKIDKCMVLVNILCTCHEIKYQKMDLFAFGTDLLGDHDDNNFNKMMRIPAAITDVVLHYYDDSSMAFDIKIGELLSKSNGLNKLEGNSFKFELNMDHKIKLRPTLTHRIRRDWIGDIDENEVDGIHEFNDIELALECEALSIKNDKCIVLVNIVCTCHEIKYQNMDLFVFGTDLLGDH